MYIVTKLFQITVLLFVSLTLHIIPWIPSLVVENVVNFSIVGLFVSAAYLVYLVMKRLYDKQKKRNVYLNTMYTLLLLSYLGLFAIAQIGISFGKSTYLEAYKFDDVTLYTYSTVDGGTEVSIKDEYLPIRSVPIATFPHKKITLVKEHTTVYAVVEALYVKVYDLKTKEKND